MIRIQSENDLLEAFREIDRDTVRMTSNLKFPLAISDYLAWVEPSGHRTFLVFEDAKSRSLIGVAFKRTHPPAEPITNMCEWCHSVSGSGKIGLLTADVNKKRRVGVYLCRDLQCKGNIEADPPSVHDLRESIGKQEKTMRVLERMSNFARANLF
jgi:FBP C-terminal treble-clef zinc-finger